MEIVTAIPGQEMPDSPAGKAKREIRKFLQENPDAADSSIERRIRDICDGFGLKYRAVHLHRNGRCIVFIPLLNDMGQVIDVVNLELKPEEFRSTAEENAA